MSRERDVLLAENQSDIRREVGSSVVGRSVSGLPIPQC